MKSTQRTEQLEALDDVARVTTFNQTALRVVLAPLADSDVCRKINAIMGHTGVIGWDESLGVVVDYPWEASQ